MRSAHRSDIVVAKSEGPGWRERPRWGDDAWGGSRRAADNRYQDWRGYRDMPAFAPPDGARVARREQFAGDLNGMIARHAQMNGVPETLVRRVVLRESGGNPRAVGHGGAMGLMQIKTSTARAMGYSGSATGLLDAETNLTYAVRYLAGAYRVAGGNADRAVSNYARGYYHAAKARGLSPYTGPRRWNAYAAD